MRLPNSMADVKKNNQKIEDFMEDKNEIIQNNNHNNNDRV